MLIELMRGAEHLRWTDKKIGLHTPLMNRNKWVWHNFFITNGCYCKK